MPVPTNRATDDTIEAADINAIAALANANETALLGGDIGQVLAKVSGDDHDTTWQGTLTSVRHTAEIYSYPHYYIAGFHDSGWQSVTIGTNVANSDDKFWAWLIWLNQGREVDALVANVQTAADASSGATIRLGLFDNDGANGLPGTKVIETGDLSIETSGQKIGTATGVTLGRTGWYWAVGKSSMGATATNPVFRGPSTGGLGLPIPGLQKPGSDMASNGGLPKGTHGMISGQVTSGAGAFAATFTPDSYAAIANSTAYPYIAVRISA